MISIVIPTYNDVEKTGPLIRFLKKEGTGIHEILVVDGGSKDGTTSVAHNEGARVLNTEKRGWSHQMNVGGLLTKGDHLYFLFPGTRPPAIFSQEIIKAVKSGFQAGCFQVRFTRNNSKFDCFSFLSRFGSTFFREKNQSLFIDKKLFEDLHGFNEKLLLFEEFDLIRRIHKKTAFKVIPEKVEVSEAKLPYTMSLRQQLSHYLLLGLFFMGCPQQLILNLYRRCS